MTIPEARAHVGLGSNVGDSVRLLAAAVEAMATEREGTCCLGVAALYRTTPLGPAQPDFFNTAVVLATDLSPRALLDWLLALELRHGRVRRERWGPRTLDLDLLLYQPSACFAPLALDEPGLRIPHPGMFARDFVLAPLCDLDAPSPDATPLEQHLARLPASARTVLDRVDPWLAASFVPLPLRTEAG